MSGTSRAASPARLWLLYGLAALTYLPTLFFHYVGEEAIFPIVSLEMWHRGEWVQQLLYGANLQHNPLLNWLIIPLASAVGWEHMLAVTRALTVAATTATGLIAAWLIHALYRDAAFAAFAALVYLTLADVFFYRGWLAYADPAFAFFVFAAIALLWIACLRRSHALLAAALGAITCAFMTKALTAYVFYGTAVLVLIAAERDQRAFLLGWRSWLLHGMAAALPLAWLYLLPDNTGQGGRMFNEILGKLLPSDTGAWAIKLVLYPLDTALRLLPALPLAVWYAWRRRRGGGRTLDTPATIALWLAVLCFLPYWLAPQSSIRYLLPVYPLAALVLAVMLWRAGERAVTVTQRWIIGVLALKLAVVLVAFPWYQKHYRGENYLTTARQILERTRGHPLYTNNVAASGLSVTAYLDVLRLPQAPLTFPPGQWESGFVINYDPDPAVGRVVERYRLGGNDLYLLCRGAACGPQR